MKYKQTWQGPSGFRLTIENNEFFGLDEIKTLFQQIFSAIEKDDFIMWEKPNV